MNQKKASSIIFIGKYDEPMRLFEEKIINIGKQPKTNLNDKIPMPDIVKYPINGYECDAWTFIGDVKPTLLLKDLISKMNIILFIINIENEESLTFLDEGWVPIIEKVEKTANFQLKNQQRILIGTKSTNAYINDQINIQIKNIMYKLHCSVYYEEIDKKNYELKINEKNLPNKLNLFEQLKSQIKLKQEIKSKIANKFNENNTLINEKKVPLKNQQLNYQSNQTKTSKSRTIGKQNSQSTPQTKKFNKTKKQQQQEDNAKIKSLSFSENSRIQIIENYAFRDSSVENLFIPSSLKRIDDYSFYGANSLERIEVDRNNRYFKVHDGLLLFKDNPNEPNSKYEVVFAFKDFNGIFLYKNTKIKYNFIRNKKLMIFESTRTLVALITKSFKYFNKCQNINHVSILASKSTAIGIRYFEDSYIETVHIESPEIIIGEYSFKHCINLKKIEFAKLQNVIILRQSFSECESLTNIDIKSSTHIFLYKDCFLRNRSLQTIKLESKEIIIGDRCFMSCSSLSSFSILDSETIKIGMNSFTSCQSLDTFKIKVSTNIEFSNLCFSNSNKLKLFEISGINKLNVSEGCFENCETLSTISFPGSYKVNFLHNSLNGCNKLSQIKLNPKSSDSFSSSCFLRSKINSSLEIGYSKIKKLEFIDKYSALESISLSIDNEHKISIDSKLIEQFPSLETFKMNVKSKLIIKQSTFSKVNKLESIYITSEILIIEENNFNKNSTLRKLEFNSELIEIHTNCFNELKNLDCIQFQSEILDISEKCFQNCPQFSMLYLKSVNYIKIGSETFSECPNLKKFIINTKEVNIDKYFTIILSKTSNPIHFVREKSSKNELYHYKTSTIEIKKQNELSVFFKKILTISKIKNPSILPVNCFTFSNFESKLYPTIFTKYIKGNPLKIKLNERKLTSTQRYSILVGITYGMKYLHSIGIFHSNLTPSNIILDKQLYPYINDYINSSKITKFTKYTAPEILNDIYSYSNDVYSYSIIAYELLTGEQPFNQYKPNQIENFVIKKGERPNLEIIRNERIKTLFQRCWSKDHKSRPKFDTILNEITKFTFMNEFGNDTNIIEANIYLKRYGIQITQEPPPSNKIKNTSMNNMNVSSPKPNDNQHKPTNNSIPASPKAVNSSNDTKIAVKQNEIIIRRYLKTRLFSTKTTNNLYIYEIADKTKIGRNLHELMLKISQAENRNFLYYTIDYNNNYTVKFFDSKDQIRNLPKYLNIQMNPKESNESDDTHIRVCILCDETTIGRKTLSNEKNFSIVIKLESNDSLQSIKSKIVQYFNPLKTNFNKYENPNIYVFKNNKFEKFTGIQKSKGRTDPLFVSWKTHIYKDLLEYINKYITHLNEI